jgi:UDP-2,4-diacetamido-2,4,6-trideoxy-beta-L-altropyranose hydrolase
MAMAENLGIEEPNAGAIAASPRIRLRQATEADCQVLWEWCNDATVRAHSFESEAISFAEHRRWLARKIADPGCLLFIACNGGAAPLGQIRYDVKDGEAIVSVSVDEHVRGRGYGTEMLRVSAARMFAETNVKAIHAFIKPGNIESLGAFARCGYRMIGSLSLHEQPATHWVLERD